MAKEYNSSMGQNSDHEMNESTDYEHNKKVMRGHAQDSRFDEGSTDTVMKVVKPPSSVSPKKGGDMGIAKPELRLTNVHGAKSHARDPGYKPGKVAGGSNKY